MDSAQHPPRCRGAGVFLVNVFVLVDLKGFEPLTSSMPWKRAPNCATGPFVQVGLPTDYHSRMTFSREQAWEILCEFTQSDALRKHGLAVEACLAAYAGKFGEDGTLWSVTGLLHDFDWEV